LGAAETELSGARPGGERRTAPIELLWDLVFAFAVTRVTTLLVDDLTWRGFGHAVLVLALVWWAWSAFVWASNAHDPSAPGLRAVLLLATALIFVTGLALPRAFASEGTLFAATYAGVRLLHLALYVDAARRGQASLAAIAGFAVTVVLGMALLLAGSFAGEAVRIPLWIAAAAIDYAGPAWLTRKRLRQLQQVAVAHFAERYSLFVIICLGESIVGIGLGASHPPLTAAAVAAVSLALVVTIGLWWTYFDRFAEEAEQRLRAHHDPVIAAADAYSYLHLIVVVGIIIFAVGAREATAHPSVDLSSAARLALCAGAAIYLVGHAGFILRMADWVQYRELIAAALSMVVYAAAGGIDAWATVGVLALVLVLLVAVEALTPSAPPPLDAGPAA
jgi:low temperature requirement protein LtrA